MEVLVPDVVVLEAVVVPTAAPPLLWLVLTWPLLWNAPPLLLSPPPQP